MPDKPLEQKPSPNMTAAEAFIGHIMSCDYCKAFPIKNCIEGRELLKAAIVEKELASKG